MNKRIYKPVYVVGSLYSNKSHNIQKMICFSTTYVCDFLGSGKTTQIPQWCVDFSKKVGKKTVACTQPRRVSLLFFYLMEAGPGLDNID